uniref:Uncharacterized protein n=1 Tax=Panagrolaimus sp. JU765 TaxID=591449 RepID=A0AC34RT39_9BILA
MSGGSSKPPEEDTWAFQEIGTPFPNNPVKALGANNTYIALWYKHGKPLMGKAYSDSGVVRCVFAWENKIISGTDIVGNIQVLQFDGKHAQKGFFYEWMKFNDWQTNLTDEGRQTVRCGNAVPILWTEKHLLGNYDILTKIATFPSPDGVITINGTDLNQMMVLLRNTRDMPPHCSCDDCKERIERSKATPAPKVMINDWADYRDGDDFPKDKPIVLALERPLNTPTGPEEHFVALWYRHGHPIVGRVLNTGGKINSFFTDGEKIFAGKTVGSLQLLISLPPSAAGFDYSWQPFKTAAKYGEKEWHPVHISYVAPCVITFGGKYEVLGGANMKEEVAYATVNGQVLKFMGKDVQNFQILCRKDRDDTMVI